MHTDTCILTYHAGNSNTVADFSNQRVLKASLQTYLESAEANAQEYFGRVNAKIKITLLDSNDKICLY